MKKSSSNKYENLPKNYKKICLYCKEKKTCDAFPRHSQKRDGLDTRCRMCIKKEKEERKRIRATAPPPPPVCDCCGTPPNKGPNADPSRRIVSLAMDHDKIAKKFRGYLCSACNTSIGKLGDNLEGVFKAIEYLKRTI